MSQRFFVPADRRWPSDGPARAVAFLHAGCIMQVAFAEWNEATVRVLRRCGCEVIAPAAQGCCGAIAIHAGDLERGRALARANIAAFERSNAAGCGSALKEYGELLAADPAWSDRAAAFSAQVRDVTEYLDELGLAPGLGVLDQVATFAEPCHLAHAQRITAAPRRLLAQIPGLRLREMNESSLCCGGAGIYGLTQPEMAERLRKRKVVNTLAVSPQVVVTANPGCALALTNGLREAGAEIAVRHVVQMLDESYAAYRPTSRASSESAATTVG
jgi:glycolate oxidase iron-sulfur subunit